DVAGVSARGFWGSGTGATCGVVVSGLDGHDSEEGHDSADGHNSEDDSSAQNMISDSRHTMVPSFSASGMASASQMTASPFGIASGVSVSSRSGRLVHSRIPALSRQ